ncbi:hypothetical protein [Streptomyces sp. NPDC057939]|uniref:hypothetical protein n=1 Tax=Streptomyces sp. NPDC057939 TaxID=3346284 RepID=UPI0036EBE293
MDRKMFRRMVATLAVVPLLAALAVGCRPAPHAILAVERNRTGGAGVLIAPCADYDVVHLSVFSHEAGKVDLSRWAIINDAMRGSLAELELFSVPQGWSVTEDTLQGVAGGGEYTVTIDGSVRGRGLDGELSFAADQLASLKPGEVLVDGDGGAKAVPRSKFVNAKSGRCEP